MDYIFQCAVFLFLYHIQGSSAGTSLFVKKGSDVQLDVQEAVPEFIFEWRVNETNNLVIFQRGGEPNLFTKTVEFSKTNYTLKLKNVQETDSGIYTAVVRAAQTTTVAEYKVTVQAPVSPVNLTVDSVFNSSDSCNLTVTCRTQDSHIRTTFKCVNQSCSKDGDRSKTTTSGADLHVYLENDSIKCNHSNQVNWTTNQGAKIQHCCPQKSSISTAGAVAGSVAGVLLVLVVTIGIVILCKKIKDKKKSNGNTVYDVPQDINSTRTQTQDLKSTYALVQFHKGPEHSTNTVNTPETIYAQVMKAGKSKSTSLESPTADLYST